MRPMPGTYHRGVGCSPMRTTLFTAAFAVLVIAACGGPKKPNPDEPGPGSDTTVVEPDTGSGSDMGAGSGSATDMGAGSGSATDMGAGSGSAVATEDGHGDGHDHGDEEDAFHKLSKDEKLKIM